jgi:hypothetical protein
VAAQSLGHNDVLDYRPGRTLSHQVRDDEKIGSTDDFAVALSDKQGASRLIKDSGEYRASVLAFGWCSSGSTGSRRVGELTKKDQQRIQIVSVSEPYRHPREFFNHPGEATDALRHDNADLRQ